MSVLTVLLTLPHSVCKVDPIKPGQRTCDRNSKTFATQLKRELERFSSIKCHLIESGQSRHQHYNGLDDNRYDLDVQKLGNPIDVSLEYPIFQQQDFNKQSKLWIELRKFTQDYYHRHKSFKNLIILDCHSFPQESNKGLDLYLIDYKVNQSWPMLGKFIQKYFQNYSGIKFDMKQGKQHYNSIVEMSQRSNIPCVLVEVLEDTIVDNVVNHFVEIITQWYYYKKYKKYKQLYIKCTEMPLDLS